MTTPDRAKSSAAIHAGLESPVTVVRVAHVSVNCHGALEAARTFYGKTLDLPEIERPEIEGVPGYWFRAGDTELHLVGSKLLGAGKHAGTPPIDPSATHHCFAVADLDAACAALDAAGIAMVSGTQESKSGTVVQVWCCDPGGNVVELQQHRTLPPSH